jgi:hypothetical protein
VWWTHAIVIDLDLNDDNTYFACLHNLILSSAAGGYSNLIFVIVAFLRALMLYPCPGCQKVFNTSKAVSSHRRFCISYKGASQDIFRKRREDLRTIRAAEETQAARLRDLIATAVDDEPPDAPDILSPLRVVERPASETTEARVRPPTTTKTVAASTGDGIQISIAQARLPQFIPEPPLSPPPQQFRPSGLPFRKHRLPRRYRDELPPEPAPVAPAIDPYINRVADHLDDDIPQPEVLPDAPRRTVETQKNEFGVYRQYSSEFPSYTPDDLSTLSDLCNAPTQRHENEDSDDLLQPWWSTYVRSTEEPQAPTNNYYAPFPNPSTFLLMRWFMSLSNMKSHSELNRLVKNVILSPEFNSNDLLAFSADREARRLDSHQDKNSPIFDGKDGWHSSSVTICVPCEKVHHPSEDAAPGYKVEGLYHRDIVEVIKSAFKEPSATRFHLTPYKEFFQPSNGCPPERIYSELYTADAFLEEHDKIHAQPRKCNLETFVIPILIWSDSTHLASFGTASLWPMYMFIGNLTKYTRCKPSSFSAHHLAYIPKVSATSFHLQLGIYFAQLGSAFQDWYLQTYEKPASAAVLRFCKREYIQAIMLLLLDPNFVEAYEKGLVLEFADMISRRGFPRFFIHSADYLEK